MSTYSSNLRIELITTGTQAGTWGNTTNDNLSTVLEAAIAGSVSVTTVAANEALTYLNGPSSTASANTSVRAILTLNTSTGANFAVYAPPVSKLYIIKNASSYTATIYNSTVIGNTTAAGTGVAIPAGKTMAVWSDGTNFTQQNTYLNAPELASPSLTGTPTAPTASPGTNTTQVATTAFVQAATSGLGTMSTQNANNVAITGGSITGITDLAVADGGTGASSFTANNVLLGNGTSAFQTVAPGTAGNVLTSNGTTWSSTALPTTVTSVSAGNGITVSGTTSVTVALDFYTGTSSSNTSYPIGSYVSVYCSSCGPEPNINGSITIYLGGTAKYFYNLTTYSGTSLSGTWRSRGTTAGTGGSYVMQRVA